MKTIRSVNHKLGSYEINKVSLSCFDDKRYLTKDGIKSYAYGHFARKIYSSISFILFIILYFLNILVCCIRQIPRMLRLPVFLRKSRITASVFCVRLICISFNVLCITQLHSK